MYLIDSNHIYVRSYQGATNLRITRLMCFTVFKSYSFFTEHNF